MFFGVYCDYRVWRLVGRGLLFLMLWTGFAPSPTQAQAKGEMQRDVVVLVPGLRAEDLADEQLPALAILRAEGAAGWMVCRAARVTDRRQLRPDGRDTDASLALTLGSGARSLAPAPPSSAGTSAGQAFPSLLSPQLPPSFLQTLQQTNRVLDHAVTIGQLGTLVHSAGRQTAVLGNAASDTPDGNGLLTAMDAQGQVDVTEAGVVPDALRPYGMRDDIAALLKAYDRLSDRVALVVLVAGDLSRAEAYAPLCLPDVAAAHRRLAQQSLNKLLSALRLRLQPKITQGRAQRLIVLAPAPAASTSARDRVAPVLLWGTGIRWGVLTSASTRTPGIVVNTDFLPLIAADLGLPLPAGIVGRPFAVETKGNPAAPSLSRASLLSSWQTAHEQLLLSERLKDVYGGLPTLQTLLVAGSAWALAKKRRRIARAIALAMVALPLGMLLLPLVSPGSVLSAGLLLTVFVLLLASLPFLREGSPALASRAVWACGTLFTVLLPLDLLTGSHLLRRAWMSYSVMETARFYGIGNEYMGVLIASMCLALPGAYRGVSAVVSRKRNGETGPGSASSSFGAVILSAAMLVALVLILGYGRFGAKVGAIPSAGLAWGVELLWLWRGRLRGRDALLALAASLALFGLLLLLDSRHGTGDQSHFARAFAGGGTNIVQIARRKLLLESYLLLHSPWSAGLCAAGIGLWWRRRLDAGISATTQSPAAPAEPNLNPRETPPVLTPSRVPGAMSGAVWAGLWTGVVVSLVCNDSGVTAAAMILLFGWARSVVRENLYDPT